MGRKEEIQDILERRIMVLDGATGTEMQKRGMPAGVCPELWAVDNPAVTAGICRSYIESGSDILYSCTFGASPFKLEEYGAADRTEEVNRVICRSAREAASAAGRPVFIAGDIGPSGLFVSPYGELAFEDAVSGFKRQVRGLLDGGADLFVIETQIDIQEARAALIAVRELTDAFVMVSMTFDEGGRSLNGTTPEAMAVTLQSLGADAVGMNCSTGPKEMLELVKRLKSVVSVPIVAKPNAGMPVIRDGGTVFPMQAEEFGTYAPLFAEAGVNIMGGCCGTTPEHINRLASGLKGLEPVRPSGFNGASLSSAVKAVFSGAESPVRIIGERINPTGKKKLQAEIKAGNMAYVRDLARSQSGAGADLLDINVGMPGVDEKNMMLDAIAAVVPVSDCPLVIDSSDPEVVEAAVRYYPGRALINSVSGEKAKLERLLPVAAKYGSMLIVLPIADNELPDKAARRTEIVEEVYAECRKYGYRESDLIVDGLVMTVSSSPEAAAETLKTVEWASKRGFGTVLGLSNISFGLPEREWVNAAFFAMACASGLTYAIANPSHELLMNMRMAGGVLCGRDRDAKDYIGYFASGERASSDRKSAGHPGTEAPLEQRMFDAIVDGRREAGALLASEALEKGLDPGKLLESKMIPAIIKVGDLYDSRKYFLPQLIASAETMKNAFSVFEPVLEAAGGKESRGTIVFATVQGDIHDIGKNIVILMLRNFGFDVIDLGKDVPASVIVDEAERKAADIIALSALMTTTMVRMPEVISLARDRGLKCPVMVGGAVVTRDWAESIGAEYSSDGVGAVKLAERLAVSEH